MSMSFQTRAGDQSMVGIFGFPLEDFGILESVRDYICQKECGKDMVNELLNTSTVMHSVTKCD